MLDNVGMVWPPRPTKSRSHKRSIEKPATLISFGQEAANAIFERWRPNIHKEIGFLKRVSSSISSKISHIPKNTAAACRFVLNRVAMFSCLPA